MCKYEPSDGWQLPSITLCRRFIVKKKNVLLKAAEAKISGQASKRVGSSRGGADVLQDSRCQRAILKQCISLISFDQFRGYLSVMHGDCFMLQWFVVLHDIPTTTKNTYFYWPIFIIHICTCSNFASTWNKHENRDLILSTNQDKEAR